MQDRTLGNKIVQTVTTGAVEILGPNPRRKAFLLTPLATGTGGIVTLSPRSNVVAGQGCLNYLLGQAFPTLIDDSMLGSFICEPWFIISVNGGEVVEILEIIYEHDEIKPAF